MTRTRIPLSHAEEEARLRRERLELSIAEMELIGSHHQLLGRDRDSDGQRFAERHPQAVAFDQQFRREDFGRSLRGLGETRFLSSRLRSLRGVDPAVYVQY